MAQKNPHEKRYKICFWHDEPLCIQKKKFFPFFNILAIFLHIAPFLGQKVNALRVEPLLAVLGLFKVRILIINFFSKKITKKKFLF